MPYAPPRHGQKRREALRKLSNREYSRWTRKNQSFYGSSVWRKVRNTFIQQNPLCAHCKVEGITKEADVVDHIVEIKDGGAALNPTNLQSLCHAHHNKKSAQVREGRVKNL